MKINWLQLVKILVPIIIPMTVPHGELIAPLVTRGIEEAEELKDSSSNEKLAHAKSLVNIGISGINAAAGAQKVDPSIVNSALNNGISTVVDVANLIHNNSK